MNFVTPYFLLGTLLAVLYGLVLVIGAIRSKRARTTFGEAPRIGKLVTHDASKRRAWKGVLVILATALAFVAAAQPQYGKGQRLVPATNVDVVIVLDYSKSMYAQDVEPSRIFRAKLEVAKLVRELRGARFGAVAFAGEALAFPLTADGSAIAQFLRQLEPNDMPVGGTAIGRALEQARELLRRDPKSENHERFIVLITDGEDLEGTPVSVAKQIGEDETTIHVVQIGGRTPERIPDVGEDGKIRGFRVDDRGEPMMTELTPKGEKQLEGIAKATPGGRIVRAEKGTTGIEEIAAQLKQQMKSEFSERVETVYADIYMYPLMLAILLLLIDALITDAPKRVFRGRHPPGVVPAVLRIAMTREATQATAPVAVALPKAAAPTPPKDASRTEGERRA